MNTFEILTHIDAEIARLQQVKALLSGEQTKRKSGRPSSKLGNKTITGNKRIMSAEGRARIAAAQKARWAKLRKAA
jgi:hypothetical protein